MKGVVHDARRLLVGLTPAMVVSLKAALPLFLNTPATP